MPLWADTRASLGIRLDDLYKISLLMLAQPGQSIDRGDDVIVDHDGLSSWGSVRVFEYLMTFHS